MSRKNSFYRLLLAINFPILFLSLSNRKTSGKNFSKEILNFENWLTNISEVKLEEFPEKKEKKVTVFDQGIDPKHEAKKVGMRRTIEGYISSLVTIAFFVVNLLGISNVVTSTYVILSDWEDFRAESNDYLKTHKDTPERQEKIEEMYELREIRKEETLNVLGDQMTKLIALFIGVLFFPLLVHFLNYMETKSRKTHGYS